VIIVRGNPTLQKFHIVEKLARNNQFEHRLQMRLTTMPKVDDEVTPALTGDSK
jgi:hypothetical protein